MKEYYALSVYPEYVMQIAEEKKNEEYRSWSTDIRGDVLICCTATKKSKGFAALLVEIYDCVKEGDSYAFLMRNIRGIKPFPVVGQQRFFKIECEPKIIDINDKDVVKAAYDEAMPLLKNDKKSKRKEAS